MASIPDELQLGKLSFSLFFQPQEFADKITLSGRLMAASEGTLDGEQLILPVPPKSPVDLPRIQIHSADKTHVLQVTLRRLAFEMNRQQPHPFQWSALAPPFFRSLAGMLRVFAGEYVRPNSFAFQCQFLHLVERSANDYLTTYVLQPDRAIDRPFMCKISLQDQLPIRGREMSLWMHVSSARKQDQPSEDRGLVVQFELSAPIDHARPYTSDEIMEIMGEAEGQIGRRIRTFLNDLFPAA